MPDQLQEMLDLIKEGQTRAQAERAQVQKAVDQLREKIEDLETQPAKKVDLTAALADLRQLVEDIDTIYTPGPQAEEELAKAEEESRPEVTPPEPEQGQSEEDKQAAIDQTKQITDVPDPDVIVSIPEHRTQPPDAPEGFVFDK